MKEPGHRWIAGGAAFVLACALLTSPWATHVDDGDADLYTVVARHLVEDDSWFDARYLPAVHPVFREHLPFGLWPHVAAIRLFGEGALRPLSTLWSLATLGLVGWMGVRMLGHRAALIAVLVLTTTETFFRVGGFAKLDPLLVFLSTSAAVPFLLGSLRPGALVSAALIAAAAALVKGPFGVLPLVAAGAAQSLVTRSVKPAFAAGIVGLVAALPLIGFLVWDRIAGGGTWWVGYLEHQVLASATGARTDGELAFWYPFRTVVGRFWPGLPLVVLGLWQTFRPRRGARAAPSDRLAFARIIALAALLTLLGLCLPTRKLWHHALIAYPALALLAGAAAAPWVDRLLGSARRERVALGGLVAVAIAAGVASAGGAGRMFFTTRCVSSGPLASALDAFPPGMPIGIVAPDPHWKLIASLAAERRLLPAPMERLPEPGVTDVALVKAGALRAQTRQAWQEVGRDGDWVLLVRTDDPAR